MNFKFNNLRVYVEENYEAMSKRAAHILASQVHLKPEGTIGLATGGTPVGMYKELVRMHKEAGLDLSGITTFNLDEYYPITRDNLQSYYYFMADNLFNHINIPKERIHIPNGMAEDINKECESYENKIKEAGGIDLQILGIGENGHIGFNEPGKKFEALTHLVNLDENTIEINSRFFDSIEEVPQKAITMGIKTIMQARKIVLLANGSKKAEIIKRTIAGDITPEVPASILQLHHDTTIVLDKAAASEVISLLI
ncbi:MAG: glucosamine-6-phosphate deaminase [Epulopiscium sp.]|nr:glucosamine-6-phosphate deaminase [Candidatus Epulonipiscium sp.]